MGVRFRRRRHREELGMGMVLGGDRAGSGERMGRGVVVAVVGEGLGGAGGRLGGV